MLPDVATDTAPPTDVVDLDSSVPDVSVDDISADTLLADVGDTAGTVGYANVTWSGALDGKSFSMTYCQKGVGPSDNVIMQQNGSAEIRCSLDLPPQGSDGIVIVSLVLVPKVGTYDHSDIYNPAVFGQYTSHAVPPTLVKVEGWKIASPTTFSVTVSSWDPTTRHLVGSLDIEMTSTQSKTLKVSGTFDAYLSE